MKTSLIVLVFSIFMLSCKKNPATSTFDENLKIKMAENVDSTKRTLTLYCYTEKVFPCSNYKIQSSYTVSGDKVTLNFTEITTSGICLTSIGPASTIINLGSLVNKNYELEINIGNSKISGQIAVISGNYKVTLQNQTKVQFTNPDLNRVPENTLYGTIHYHTTTTSATVEKFIDSLQYFGALTTTYTPGDYGNFQIDPNGQIKQIQDAGYYFTRYYIFNYMNSSVQLKNLVKRFGSNYPNLLLITLNTTKGETFYSWIP